MQYRLSQITKITDAQQLTLVGKDSLIRHIVFDSRRIDFPAQSLFLAFSSASNDGHHYIQDAYDKGMRAFMISRQIELTSFPQAQFLLVPDTLTALQALARFHRQQFKLPVIGITGSNGKTIVKEWLFQLLASSYNIVRSPRSYNSQIGVPLSVLQIDESHHLGIFEAGISTTGEMQNIAPLIDCTIGIFTNIGEAHREGFKSIEEKIKEKLRLFDHCNTLLYCADHPQIEEAVTPSDYPNVLRWSRHKAADLRILQEGKESDNQYHIQAKYKGQPHEIRIPFSDPASVENAIHCWLLLLYLSIEPTLITARMQELDSIPMRLELKAAINNCTLINDSYNSDLTSLAVALNFLRQQSGQLSRTLILSDIFQSGIESRQLYKQVNMLLEEYGIDRLIGIGREVGMLQEISSVKQQSYFPNTEDFLESALLTGFRSEAILLKGARDFAFERIARRLARKSHNTVLEVNLDALAHNLRLFREALKPETKLMVMVKAAAYGSGSDEVARLLEFLQVDYLAVAYADEGVELREAGVSLPIMVLNPEHATFDWLIQYNLEPEIYSQQLLEQLIDYFPESKPLRIHLKLDTGMHRLGFEAENLEQLTNTLQQNPWLNVASVFSHLAASDESDQDTFTIDQINKFNQYYQRISAELPYQPIRHILNTNGILRFSGHQYDMVRLGIGLYGIGSSPMPGRSLKTVLSLKATISQIKFVPAGETIGYSRKGKAEKDLRIATISIGYADGLLRSAGNGRFSVMIRGKSAPTVGNVCMDMTMVDISNIPEAIVGDEILIFGASDNMQDQSVEVLAACYNTLVYEVFTGISERVKRVYYQE